MKNFQKELKQFLRLFFAAHGAFTSDKVDGKTYRKSGLLQLAIYLPLGIILIIVAIKYGFYTAIVGSLVIAFFMIIADFWSRRP